MPPKAKYLKQGILLFIFPIILLGIDPSVVNPSEEPEPVYNRADPLAKIGDYPYPTNPLNDRAQGFLLQGKVKNAVTNFVNYISW